MVFYPLVENPADLCFAFHSPAEPSETAVRQDRVWAEPNS